MQPSTHHPHAYTLDLMRIALERLPSTFSSAKRKTYAKRLERYVHDRATKYEEIQETIAELGKDSWVYRKAYEEIFAQYGRASEEAHLLEKLDSGIREKYERFIHEGGKIGYIAATRSLEQLLQPSPFERYFTPEEKFAIAQALLAAKDAARAEIDELIGEKKKEEYTKLVKEYKVRQRMMESKLDELRSLATVSKKWTPSIQERIRTIEEGWSVVAEGWDLADLEKETEYWRGTLESFLHA